MLLRNRISGIDSAPVTAATGLEHLSASSIAVLRWLNRHGVDYVVVGPVARAVRGDTEARGAVSIVPAPYGRNLERLARALSSVQARLRSHADLIGIGGQMSDAAPVKLTAEQLIGPTRWSLRCGDHDLDVEGHPAGAPSYQELLFEAVRFELAPEISAEVAAPEDIEFYDQFRRTGVAPEIKVSRASASPAG